MKQLKNKYKSVGELIDDLYRVAHTPNHVEQKRACLALNKIWDRLIRGGLNISNPYPIEKPKEPWSVS